MHVADEGSAKIAVCQMQAMDSTTIREDIPSRCVSESESFSSRRAAIYLLHLSFVISAAFLASDFRGIVIVLQNQGLSFVTAPKNIVERVAGDNILATKRRVSASYTVRL